MKAFNWIGIIVVLALLVTPLGASPVSAAPTNLVDNGSFEQPIVTNTVLWDIFASGTPGLGWMVEWYDGNNSYDGSTRPEPAHLELHRGVNGWLPSHGEQHAELDTDWDGPGGGLSNEPASVRIYQDLPTVPGGIYQLSFAFSPRPEAADNQLEVKWDGAVVDTLSADGSGLSNTSWTVCPYEVTATDNLTRLEFTDLSTPDSLGTFLDHVSVTAKPGSITIIKDANPDDDQDFQFTGDLGSFTLDDDGGADPTHLNIKTVTDLSPGSCNVTETVPAGWNLSISGAPSTGSTANINLDPGEDVTVTFTNTRIQPSSISGHKWADCNENTTWDEGEVGLIGWEINLYNKEDTQWVLHSSNVTGPDGAYTFTGLQAGQHKVEEVPQNGWVQTYPTIHPDTGTRCHIFTFQGGEDETDVNFGNHSTGGSICANKVVDFSQGTRQGGGAITDPNRVDPNEALGPPDSMDKSVPTFFTLGYGGWIIVEFAHAITGSITVYETTWGGPHGPETVNVYGTDEYTGNTTTWTLIGEATNNNGYDNGTGYGVNTHPTTLTFTTPVKYVKIVDTTSTSTNSDDAFDVDAVCGEYACDEGCSITGHKYRCDASDNCTQEGLEGWTINLTGPVSDNTTTDDNGYYEFTGLADGTYTLSETMQDGWVNCTPTSYEITLDDCQIHGRGVIVSDTNTLVTAGNAGTHPHNAVYAWEHSTWWPGLSYKFGYPNNNARWIWESYRVAHPIAGDIVEFERTFYVPGTPTDNCTLYITCDNGYEVTLNGNPVGSAQLATSWETSNLTQSFVDTTNWQSVESYDASGLLQSGNNTLAIKTANEYMGDLDGQQDGTIDENPAGLIYELSYEFDTTEINFCNREGIPNITIIKTADPTAIMSGEHVTYTYQVMNTGDVDLTSITVTDDQGLSLTLTNKGDGDDILSPGETWVYQATANPTEDITNTGTACGTGSTQQQVCAEGTATVEILEPRGLISGHKYRCDATDNCTQEGLEGWAMNLTGPVSDSTPTDSNGYYEFTDLPDGTYTVSEELKPGWENCTPDSYQITLCSGQFVVASDNNTMVTAGNVGGGTTYPYNAVEAWEYNLSDPNPPDPNNSYWDQAVSSTHAFSNCADWIWESEFVVNPAVEETVEFERSFYIPGTPAGGTLHITCDNGYEVKLNGTLIGVDGDWTTVESYNVLANLQSGNNLLQITATNLQTPGSTPTTNPAGLIYELFYDSDVNFCNRQLGSITIIKEADPADGTDFEFSGDLGANFFLKDGESQPFNDLSCGDYDVTEIVPAAWDLTNIAITEDKTSNSTSSNTTATIELDPGESVTVTFTNTKKETSILVEKVASPTTATVGGTITYTYAVTNTGEVTTDNITLVDDMLGIISLQKTTLAPGESTQSTGGPYTYTVTPGDLGGPIINVATANGTYPVNNQISANATASVTPTLPPPSPSGLGGTGTAPVTSPCPLTLTVNVLGNTTTASMTLDGVLCQDCVALGPQGQPVWEADAGTKLTLANNKVPRLIKLALASSPPPPSNAAVVGPMYELNAYPSLYSSTPSPITISPLCSLVLPYGLDELPDNTSATLIAYYDEELGKWVDLETAGYVAGGVEVPNVLISQVTHFTTFAVLAKLAAQAPAKTTEAPASTAQVAPETAEQPSSAINWWLIGGIIAVVLALAISLAVRRKQLRGY